MSITLDWILLALEIALKASAAGALPRTLLQTYNAAVITCILHTLNEFLRGLAKIGWTTLKCKNTPLLQQLLCMEYHPPLHGAYPRLDDVDSICSYQHPSEFQSSHFPHTHHCSTGKTWGCNNYKLFMPSREAKTRKYVIHLHSPPPTHPYTNTRLNETCKTFIF